MLELERAVLWRVEGDGQCRRCLVQIGRRLEPALLYPALTGPVAPGDRVWVNTAAGRRRLGTGGAHFVVAGPRAPAAACRGHILKLNYTPWQLPVLAVEEQASPYHAVLQGADSLDGLPVVALELHSQLAPAVAGVWSAWAACCAGRPRVVYVAVDGGALPVWFSRQAAALTRAGLLAGTITCGQTFGGGLEAVNVYSGLLAARHVLQADVAVVAMGPGQVGTATPFGFSGIWQGLAINAAHALGGRPVACLRLDFSDPRPRHCGLSHHTRTVLGRVALARARVAVPRMGRRTARLLRLLRRAGALAGHDLVVVAGAAGALRLLRRLGVELRTMGRGPRQSPEFFLAAAAAGRAAVGALRPQTAGSRPRPTPARR